MKKAVRSLSPATVIASIALFVSLGGVSYGVAAGSIDSREIENNTVQTQDVRNNGLSGATSETAASEPRPARRAVRGLDVNDGSPAAPPWPTTLWGSRDQQPALDIPRLAGVDAKRSSRRCGACRPQPPTRPPLPGGPRASCPKGTKLLGGGARVVAPVGTPVALSTSGPSSNGWDASAYATAATGNWQLVSVAICG